MPNVPQNIGSNLPASQAGLQNYYNRYNPEKNYEALLMRDGYAGQASEINEIQSIFFSRVRGLADAIFSDGAVIKDAGIIVDHNTGAVRAHAGQIYLAGAVRGVPDAEFVIATTGTVVVGIYLRGAIISELEDPELYNPAAGSPAEGQAGACRLRVTTHWGYQGDGQEGNFYPVWHVDDGVLRVKEAPANLDAVAQALAQYDRQSTGGSYIVDGFRVLKDADTEDGKQVYTVSEGTARVNGIGVEAPTSRRLIHAAEPDLRFIEAEGHLAQGGTEQVAVSFPPLKDVTRIAITKETTQTLTHAAFVGAVDTISETGVIEIVEVKQGQTTYEPGTDYVLSGNGVDWSPAGNEPATGSTYTVKFKHLDAIDPEAVSPDGCTISGAVPGTLIQISYNQMLPRLDVLALGPDGRFSWLTGVSTTGIPRPPAIPDNMLGIATVEQTWRETRRVLNNGDRIVSNSDILWMTVQISAIRAELSRQRLEADIATREAGAKKGLFVDPFLNDRMRDQGIEQTAAIFGGELTLAVDGIAVADVGDTNASTLHLELEPVIEQTLRTGSMAVNPYQAFDLTQGYVELQPALDRWTETTTQWTSPRTETITQGWGLRWRTSTSQITETVSEQTSDVEFIRQREVTFDLRGLQPGEQLASITFDSINVTPEEI